MTRQLVDEAEIVVVGAGPAGSACARRLATAGHDVLLIDQSTFPRDKPCGDGLTQSAVAELSALGLDDLVASRPPIEGLRIVSRSGSSEYRPYRERMTARCIPRAVLDERLFEAALEEGVRFRHARVDRVTPDERQPAIVLADPTGGDQPTIRARLVIAADGATSRLARDLGWARQVTSPNAYAVRAYFRSERELDPVFDIYLPLEFDDRRFAGYGWVFPIEPHVANIGIGYWRAPGVGSPTRIREVLGGFVRQLEDKTDDRFGELEIRSPLFGSPLGVVFNADRCEGEGVLLVGDAARTTDPVSGEGIAYALAGARIVADIAMRRRRGVEIGRRVGQAFAQQFPCLLQDVALPLRIVERRYNGGSRDARKASEYPFVRTVRGVLTTPELVQPLTDSVVGRSLSAEGAAEWLAAVDAYLMGSIGTSFPVATQLLSSKLRFGAGPALSSAFWSVASSVDIDGASLDYAAAFELIRVGTSLARDTVDRPAENGARANNAMCLLIGDFAFSRAIHHASAVGPAFARIVGAAIQRVCDAHFAESVTYFKPSRSPNDILWAARGQTSLLLRVAVEAAGAKAAVGAEAQARYVRYADELGVAIRLAEDLAMLFVGDAATGQMAGEDLAVGAYSTAVLWSASRDPVVRDALYDVDRPVDATWLTAQIIECGGLNHAIEDVETRVNRAKQALVESDPAALTQLADAVAQQARSVARTSVAPSMKSDRKWHADDLVITRDSRGAVPDGKRVEHQEDSIEVLFREHLAQTYGSSVPVPAVAAASSKKLRAIWELSGVSVPFNQFVQDVFGALQHAYDQKYGVWENVNDLRTLYPRNWHIGILPHTSLLRAGARILGVGVNDGREVRQLFEDRLANLDLLDISARAIGRLARQLGDYSHIRSFVGTFEDWAADYDKYDLFFSLRTLNCTAVDRSACVRKSIELVKPEGTLVYSVANGYVYLDNGVPKALNGMFSYETGAIDVQRPREIANEICREVDAAGARVVELRECPTEIFVVATKERSHGIR